MSLAAFAGLFLFSLAAPAGAHVDIDPREAASGSTVTVTASFLYGNDGGATPGLVLFTDAATTIGDDDATTTTNDLPGTSLEAEARDDGDQSVAPWVIGSGVLALVAIGVGGTVLKRRMD